MPVFGPVASDPVGSSYALEGTITPGTITVSETTTYAAIVPEPAVTVSETASHVIMQQPGLIVSEAAVYLVYRPVSLLTGAISATVDFLIDPDGTSGLPNIFTTKPVLDDVDIILRRGPSSDLPGHPYIASPLTWAPGLDEAELAFSTDEGRIFLGSDPTQNLPQATRKAYPYQNIEVLGELSTDAFAKMHGNLIKRQDNSAYYWAQLPPSNSPQNITVNGSPFSFVSGELFSATVNYAVYCNGDMVRHGDLEITYSDPASIPEVFDCFDMLRTEFFNPFAFDFTVGSALNTSQFALSVAIVGGTAYLQYMSAIPGSVTIRFNSSIPFSTVPKFGIYSETIEPDDIMASEAKLHIKASASTTEQNDILGST